MSIQSINRLIEKSKNSHGGFTVLELLVASLLLGMLMTILTMVFNQSSIAWKTGVASTQDMDAAREKVAAVRYEADNAYVWGDDDKAKCIRSVFDDSGSIRTDRLIDDFDGGVKGISESISDTSSANSYKGGISASAGNNYPPNVYIINVRSWGPDRDETTRYDNIYGISPINDTSEW